MADAVKFANWNFVRYTALALVLSIFYLGLSTVGRAVITQSGSAFQSAFMPVYGPVVATTFDENQQPIRTILPAFQFNSMTWDGDDLVLTGQFCKVQPYDFVSVQWSFGDPAGISDPAEIAVTGQQVNRPTGCQNFRTWRLLDAGLSRYKQFFGLITSRPSHHAWDVYYSLGPFPIPSKPGEEPNGAHELNVPLPRSTTSPPPAPT